MRCSIELLMVMTGPADSD